MPRSHERLGFCCPGVTYITLLTTKLIRIRFLSSDIICSFERSNMSKTLWKERYSRGRSSLLNRRYWNQWLNFSKYTSNVLESIGFNVSNSLRFAILFKCWILFLLSAIYSCAFLYKYCQCGITVFVNPIISLGLTLYSHFYLF